MREAPPPRRTLVGLPRLLRPPGRELLDEHRPAHERRLRLHLDADQRAARRGPDPRRAWPSTCRARPSGPPSTPSTRPGRSATPTEFSGQLPLLREVLDALRIRHVGRRGLRGRRRHRHAHPPGRRAGPRGGHLHRRPRRLPARHRQGHACIYPVRGVSEVWRMDPAAVTEKYLVPPERYSDLAALVGETSDNLPGVPGVGPEDGRQVARPVRRPRRGGRPRRRDQGQGRREPARAPRRRAAQPPPQPARRRPRPAAVGRRPRAPVLGPRGGAPGLRRPGVPGAARAAVPDLRRREGRGRGRLRARGRRVHRRRPGGAASATAPSGARLPHGVVVVRPLPRRQRRCRCRRAGG